MLGKGLGGIEQVAVDYALALTEQGHEVLTITHPDAGINEVASQHGLHIKHLDNRGAWDWWAAWKLKRLCKKFNSDIIITHGNRALCLAAKLAAGSLPHVTVAHNYHTKHMPKADYIFCITEHLRDNILITFPSIKKTHCFHTPNMIAPKSARDIRDWHSPPRIGAIGRMVQKKGFDVWIKALAELQQRGHKFEAWLAGTGEEKLALETLSAQLGLQDTLTFKGWVEDAQTFYQDIDIFCLPSHHEPFGIVVIEAMAAGLPVIATKSEGPIEILGGQTCGILVDKDNPKAMADAMAAMLYKPSKAISMGKRAHTHAMEHYTRSVRGAHLSQIIEKLLQRLDIAASDLISFP